MLQKYQNNLSIIGKWDFHPTPIQDLEPPDLDLRTLISITWYLELINIRRL